MSFPMGTRDATVEDYERAIEQIKDSGIKDEKAIINHLYGEVGLKMFAEYSEPVDEDKVELQWYLCTQCDHEIAASHKPKCPYCGCLMSGIARAGEIVDRRES